MNLWSWHRHARFLKKLSIGSGLLFSTLLLGTSACRRPIPQTELVVLLDAPASAPDPRFAVSAYDFKLIRLIYAPLVSVDNLAMEPEPHLAERVEITDATHIDVFLRPARFADGSPVTAADVVCAVTRLRQPDSRLASRFAKAGLQAVVAIAPTHVRFTLMRPYAPFMTDLDFGLFHAADERGKCRSLPAEERLVGAGPYTIERHTGETWHLRANPHYFRVAPLSPQLTVRTIRDDNSRLLALVGGSADITQNTVTPLLYDSVAHHAALKMVAAPSSVFTYMGVNCDDPILRDVRVRRAIAYALDRALLIDSKFRDKADIATGMLPRFHWAYAGDVAQYKYDPAQSRRLLDEAGYPDPDGDGPQPRFTLVYRTSNQRFRVALAQVIERMLGEVGIGIDLRVGEFASFFADVKKGNYQLFSMQIPEIVEPDLYAYFLSSARIPSWDHPDAGGNRVRYRNSQVDRLLEQGTRQMERSERRATYGQVQKILADELPMIPLWHEYNVAVMRKNVDGFALLPTAQWGGLVSTGKSRP